MQVGGRLRWLRDTCGGQRRVRAFRVCVSAYVLTPILQWNAGRKKALSDTRLLLTVEKKFENDYPVPSYLWGYKEVDRDSSSFGQC